MFKSLVTSKYTLVTADFKTVELKYVDQGAEKSLVQEYLDKFKKLRDRNKLSGNEKNIDTWGKKSFQEFQEKIDDLEKTKTKSEQRKGALDSRKNIPGADVIAENKDWRVYKIETNAAAAELGKGTEWCIRFDPSEYWDDYYSVYNIYFLISKNRDEKDQWYKIALIVDAGGEKTYWDIKDKDHDSIPSTLNIPNFEIKKQELNTEKKQLKAVKKNGLSIQYIKNPSEAVQLEAIKYSYGKAIQYIENPTEAVQLEVIKKDSSLIRYIKNTSEKIQLELVKEKPYSIEFIQNPTEAVQLEAVKKSGYHMQYIKNPSEQVQLEAVKEDPYSIQYIENPTEAVQLEAVKKSGYHMQYIKNPSEQVQLEAVKENPYSIQYIENPTEAVQLEVVKKSGYHMQYIKNPSEQVQLEVVKKSGYNIEYIKNPSEQVQLEAVKENPYSIQYIENPTEAVQLEAVKKNPSMINYIKNPTEKVLKLAK